MPMSRFFRINTVKNFAINNDPVKLSLHLNLRSLVSFELDTGSHISTLCERDAMKCGASIQATADRALAYGGASINLIGECKIPVKLGSFQTNHKFLVVNNREVNLLSKDLCNAMNI